MEAIEITMNGEGEVWVKEKIIGSGSSATVYLAKPKQTQERRRSLGEKVMAVKSSPLSNSESLFIEKEVFLELKNSPYILQYYGHTITTEKNIETMNLCLEFAPGGCLSDLIKKQNRGLSEHKVRRYTCSILQGLNHMHRCGFVHCDLKPQNILICENDVPKLADFDLSKRIGQQKSRYTFIGTPRYVGPEAIFSKVHESISDVWGVRCIVLEMLCGRPAWRFPNTDVDSVLSFIADSEEVPVIPKVLCGRPAWRFPNTDVDSILSFTADSEEVPLIPKKLSTLAKDFLSKCLVRDTGVRWSADMLLKHPFVVIDIDKKNKEEGLKRKRMIMKRDGEEEEEEVEEAVKKWQRLWHWGSNSTNKSRCWAEANYESNDVVVVPFI